MASSEPRKNSMVGSGDSMTEFLRGVGCGILYGMSSPLIGHPIDSIKTKMQAQTAYFKGGAVRTLLNTVKNEGFFALYRGLLPPLLGSSIFRSIQFGVYNSSMAGLGAYDSLATPIPGTNGLEPRVLLSAVLASSARAVVETPLEFIKVRRQVGTAWRLHARWADSVRHPWAEFRNLFSGFGVSWGRTVGMMGSFFLMVDYLERLAPEVIAMPLLGPFVKGGVCATLAWWIVWPLENLKNQIQAGTAGVPKDASLVEKLRFVMRTRDGFAGLYRGIGPGSVRSFIANGTSMIVFNTCQEFIRKRDAERAAALSREGVGGAGAAAGAGAAGGAGGFKAAPAGVGAGSGQHSVAERANEILGEIVAGAETDSPIHPLPHHEAPHGHDHSHGVDPAHSSPPRPGDR